MHWLFTPLRDEDVLLTGERVLYRQRRHWAALTPELAQFAAVLFLHSAFSMRNTTGLSSLLVLGSLISIAILFPLLKFKDWSIVQIMVAGLIALWAFQSAASIQAIAAVLVLLMGLRFVVNALKWAFFQRLYLTDRRVMEIDGFLGTTVNSMPLAKVTDVMLRRTPAGEVLGYGTFRVESAGQDQALSKLDYLLHPEHFHDMVVASPTWRL